MYKRQQILRAAVDDLERERIAADERAADGDHVDVAERSGVVEDTALDAVLDPVGRIARHVHAG